MSLRIGRTVIGSVQTNVYFVYDEVNKKALVFDPAGDGKGIYNKLKDAGIDVAAILLTHGHFDHIFGVKDLKEAAGVKVYASEDEDELLKTPSINCSEMVGRPCSITADVLLKDNEELDIDGIKFKVLFTPGHTEGSCCYYFEEDGILISGDTLFFCSCGRTDLPTGSGAKISRSLRDVLMKLPDDVQVYPGHGDSTTIGFERENNLFC